jgi:serine/threonine-protein kinase
MLSRAMGVVASPDVVGRYAIYGRIASGGMATVHLGRQAGAAGFSRIVAIKRLHPHLAEDPEFISTMIDEARLASRIHHPNVVSTLDVVATQGELLLVMEYVRGEALGRLLKVESQRARRIPLPVASAIVSGALFGLQAAHEATSDRGLPLGIVHRDISPQNILVGVDGVPRVIDFGVAKAAFRLQTTRQGVVKGKMAYMAPEQLEGGEVTRRTDVYAMAVVLWEVLTGQRLFQADNDAQLVVRVLAGAKQAPSVHAPEVSPELDALVMKALAPSAEARFASAREMAEALMRLVPPAFPNDVGAWVEEVARDGLAKHAVMLAEIESSRVVATPGVALSSAALRDTIHDDVPTVASQPSSLSVATPQARSRPPARRRLASVLALAALLVAGAAAIAWRGARSAAVAPVVADSTTTASVTAALQPAQEPPTATATPIASPAPAAAASSAPAAGTRPPASATARAPVAPPARRPKAQPTGSIRFTQPD